MSRRGEAPWEPGAQVWYQLVYALRRVLYVQAGVFLLAGVTVASLPGTVAGHVFAASIAPSGLQAWIRLTGVEGVVLAMLMIMVGHRVEELWWWAWAFAIGAFAMTSVVLLNAAFGLAPAESALAWWLFALVLLGLTCGLLYGLFVSSRERPLP